MDNFAQYIIEKLSKMDLTAAIAQKSCLMLDLKLSHIILYIKYKKCEQLVGGLPENRRLMGEMQILTQNMV